MAAHAAVGALILRFVYPRTTPARHARIMRWWSRKLLRILAVEARVEGPPPHWSGPVMVVANHVSWLPHPDPHYTGLAVTASVEAIFLSTFVLITQNRMQAHADKRADLDLQISLLAEHEVTQIMMLVRDMARRMGVERAQDPALDELQRTVEPASVLDTIEASEAEILSGRRGTRRRPDAK